MLWQIPGYKIDCIVGNGANGIIFESTEEVTERKVAIKIWLPDPTKHKSNVTRSKEEIIKLSRLNSHDVVKMYSFNKIEGNAYCIMEYIKGRTMRSYLHMYRPGPSMRYELAMQIIDGLQRCHKIKVYHGDLHLDNIMITEENEIKLLDFGTSVFSREYSHERDSKLIAQSLIKVIGPKSEELLNLHKLRYEDYSPECMCWIMKALSKVYTLLGFQITDTVVHDLALFMAIVPFFDIVKIELILQKKMDESEEDRRCLEFFRKTLAVEIANRHPIISVNIDKEVEFFSNITDREIERLYDEWKEYFVSRVAQDKSIYRSLDDRDLFNGPLFSDSVPVLQF